MSILRPHSIQIKDFQEITVAIDMLDDIFSDFDPRPLHQRALSEDFLKEIQKFYRETSTGKMLVVFLGPVALKDLLEKNQLEKAIITHLHQEFKTRAQQAKKAIKSIRTTGLRFILFGATLLVGLTLSQAFTLFPELGLKLGTELLLPFGWFGMWEGFSHLVQTPYKLKEEATMYDKLSKAQYSFKFLGENKPTSSSGLTPLLDSTVLEHKSDMHLWSYPEGANSSIPFFGHII